MQPTGADSLHNNTVYEWLLQSTFIPSARAQMAACLAPHLTPLVRPGAEVLDLCCGTGPMSFWFEEQGARVLGIDFAPYMIALAREEADRRNATARFIEADIFAHDFGRECFDLIACFGNSISDFPLLQLGKLAEPVVRALKPGGRFLVEYHDGSYESMVGRGRREGLYQESPERISFRFKGYVPEIGARVNIMHNETLGVAHERKSYVYTVPSVQLALSPVLVLERHVVLAENHFLDSFGRTDAKVT